MTVVLAPSSGSTLQTVMDLARKPLNDAKDGTGSDATCRYPDADLLAYTLHALLAVFRRRPDLFFGSFSSPPSLLWPATQVFPLPDEYLHVLADYVTARASAMDDENVDNGRAAAFFALFGKDVG